MVLVNARSLDKRAAAKYRVKEDSSASPLPVNRRDDRRVYDGDCMPRLAIPELDHMGRLVPCHSDVHCKSYRYVAFQQ